MKNIQNKIFELAEITIAVIFILFLAPIIVLILFIIAIETKQFPIIRQYRSLSLSHNFINIYKIRTIADTTKFKFIERKNQKIFQKEEFQKFVSPFCKWLRISGIDEILQLINVIKGEMSFIGPRPLLREDLKNIKKESPNLYYRKTKISSKPGITGFWQIYGNRELGTKNLVELDEFYEKNKSLVFNIKIIVNTTLIILSASHSDSIFIGNRSNLLKRIWKPGFTFLTAVLFIILIKSFF